MVEGTLNPVTGAPLEEAEVGRVRDTEPAETGEDEVMERDDRDVQVWTEGVGRYTCTGKGETSGSLLTTLDRHEVLFRRTSVFTDWTLVCSYGFSRGLSRGTEGGRLVSGTGSLTRFIEKQISFLCNSGTEEWRVGVEKRSSRGVQGPVSGNRPLRLM